MLEEIDQVARGDVVTVDVTCVGSHDEFATTEVGDAGIDDAEVTAHHSQHAGMGDDENLATRELAGEVVEVFVAVGRAAIREVDESGKVVWEYTGVENTGDAQRLPNGNTLISCGTQKRVIEVTPDKQIVWEFSAKDAPEVNLTWASSIQPLKNGNLLIGNFLRGQEGKGAHVFEVTRDKKVVWKWDNHAMIKSLTTVRAIDEMSATILFDDTVRGNVATGPASDSTRSGTLNSNGAL